MYQKNFSENISNHCVSQPTPMTPHPLAGFTSWPLVAVKCYMPSASISYLQQMLHIIWHIIFANNFYMKKWNQYDFSFFYWTTYTHHLHTFGHKPTEVVTNSNYKAVWLIPSKVFFGFNKPVSDYFYVSKKTWIEKKRNQMQYWSALEFNFLLQIPSGSLDQTKRNSAVALYVCTSYVG